MPGGQSYGIQHTHLGGAQMHHLFVRSSFAVLVLTALFMDARGQSAVPVDTSVNAHELRPALQFHMVGGFGALYLHPLSSSGRLRFGVDLTLNQSKMSGDEDSYSRTISTPPGNVSSQYRVFDSEEDGSAIRVSVSGVYLHELYRSGPGSLLLGAGATAYYGRQKSTSRSELVGTYQNAQETDVSRYEYKQSQWGVGPVVVCFVQARVVAGLSVSAELGGSAVHEWTSETHLSTEAATPGPASSRNEYMNGGNRHRKGWVLDLTGIVLGVVIDL
jgi:hypothetical protein